MLTNDKQTIAATVDDMPLFPDPDANTARQKEPTLVEIRAIASEVRTPRAITQFADLETGRTFRVLKYKPSPATPVISLWECEAQRDA